MAYYSGVGDYYRGDYYRGDFGRFVKKGLKFVGKTAKALIKSQITDPFTRGKRAGQAVTGVLGFGPTPGRPVPIKKNPMRGTITTPQGRISVPMNAEERMQVSGLFKTRRRMNVANVRALRRALRRVSGFGKLASRTRRDVARAATAIGVRRTATRKRFGRK